MHVRFATPTLGEPCEEYKKALAATLTLFDRAGIAVSYQSVVGDMYVSRARNKLASEFLASGADKLFSVDDDLGWKPIDALRVALSEHAITFGAYPYKKDELEFPVGLLPDPGGYPVRGPDGLIRAATAPGGFLCVSRAALEAMVKAQPWLAYKDDDADCFDFFQHGAAGGVWWGEDSAFSNRWRSLDPGNFLWCVPDIDFVHHDRRTGKAYPGNYHKYLRALGEKDGFGAVLASLDSNRLRSVA